MNVIIIGIMAIFWWLLLRFLLVMSFYDVKEGDDGGVPDFLCRTLDVNSSNQFIPPS